MLLTYPIRDLRRFINLIAVNGTQLFDSLDRHGRKTAIAIIKMYYQQLQMFKDGTHTCAERIVSIFQSHIRPIVRGKSKPLGRPPKEAETEEYQAKMAEAVGERNEMEATFGTEMWVCRANDIRAKYRKRRTVRRLCAILSKT